MEKFFQNLRLQILDLPGEEAHVKMAPLKRPISSTALKVAKNVRESAVAIIFLEIETEPHFVLIQRPEYNGTHSKQISFPGGKRDLEDKTSIDNATREAEEEIGLNRVFFQHIGSLTPVFIPVSSFQVFPHVFSYTSLIEFKREIREVDEIFTVPVKSLLLEKNVISTNVPVQNGLILKNVPAFNFNGKIVWGATAIILNELKEILLRKMI